MLYPFLHLPIILDVYSELWEDSFLWSADRGSQWDSHRIQVAQVFLCLATGRCTGSSRVDTEDGRHSAGWSLYCAAIDIFGDIFDVFRERTRSLQALQTFVLMVGLSFPFDMFCFFATNYIYSSNLSSFHKVVHLFRLDANERAEKILALAISHAHHLGLHRQKVLE